MIAVIATHELITQSSSVIWSYQPSRPVSAPVILLNSASDCLSISTLMKGVEMNSGGETGLLGFHLTGLGITGLYHIPMWSDIRD